MPAKADSHPQNADRIHDSAYQVAEGIVLEFEKLGQTSAAWSLMLGRIKAIAEERDRAHLLISDMRQAARRSATAVARLAGELDGMLAVNPPSDTFEPIGAAANRVVGDLPVDRALDDVARRRWLAADGEVDADGRPVPLAAGEAEVCIGRQRRLAKDDASLVRAGLVETVRDGVDGRDGCSCHFNSKTEFIIHDETEAVEVAKSAVESKPQFPIGTLNFCSGLSVQVDAFGKVLKAPGHWRNRDLDEIHDLNRRRDSYGLPPVMIFSIDDRRREVAMGEPVADGRRVHLGRDVSSWIVPGLVEPMELSSLIGKSPSEVMEIAQRDIAFGVGHLRTPSDPIIPETFDDGSAADPTNDVDETAILAESVAALGDRHAGPSASSAAVLDSIRAGMARRVPIATSARLVPRTAAE